MQKKYVYGKSVISSKLKFNFESSQLGNMRIKDKFMIELRVYCGRKKMYEEEKTFNDSCINKAIEKMFSQKVEEGYTFHKGHNYYATFKVYKIVPVRRPKYKKTDTYINTERRKYLLQERINISF